MTQPALKTRRKIVKALLEHAKRLPDWAQWTNTRSRLTLRAANKILLGLMWDRNMNADFASTNSEQLLALIDAPNGGSTFWEAVDRLEVKRLRNFLRYGNGGKSFQIYWNQYTKQLKNAARFMLETYDGDPRKIWNGQKDVNLVRKRLKEIPGIGKALASFGVHTLARSYGLLGGRKSKPQLDVKTDVHIMRVFRRTGLAPANANAKAVIHAARELYPSYPAALDGPAWDIGRNWCHESSPECSKCKLTKFCPRIGVSHRA
jgi:endonuclease III